MSYNPIISLISKTFCLSYKFVEIFTHYLIFVVCGLTDIIPFQQYAGYNLKTRNISQVDKLILILFVKKENYSIIMDLDNLDRLHY